MTLPLHEAAARAEAFLKTGDTTAAEAIYRRLFDETAPADRLLPGLAIGACLARRRQWPVARAHFDALAEEFPNSAAARALLGAVKVEESDFEGGRDDLDRAIALDPDESIAYIKRGELFRRLGLLRQAEADFQHALRLPIADQPTRDFCRNALLSVRAELAAAIERKAPSPMLAARSLFRWKNRTPRDATRPVPAGRTR